MTIVLSENHSKNNNPFFQERSLVEQNLKDVKKVIAVHSGKGGVGKSTFAVNFASALLKKSFRVGLLDADLDCPSMHLMSGAKGRVFANESMRLIPLENSFGLKVLSVGNMDEDHSKSKVMRGPIMFKLIFDMLSKTEWNDLDFLVIDLPPGTGDNPLTIMQLTPLYGLIIITQPQKAALSDAEKSLDMAKKLNVKVIGIVENMSGQVFGQGGANSIAKNHKTTFLGSIPLDSRIRESSDKGLPAVLEYKDLYDLYNNIIQKSNLL